MSDIAIPDASEPPAGSAIPGVGFKIGEADCGRGIQEVLDVIKELAGSEIPSVVIGAKALVYYGARRAPQYWEICVPDHLYKKATDMFASAPLNQKYDPWPKIMPQPGTLIHTYPCFTLKGINFFFNISPTFENCIDCDPQNCEKSKLGVPYPKLELFAQSLLKTQRFHDLENLIDGMNLTEEWGDEYLDLSGADLGPYIKEMNRRIQESLSHMEFSILCNMRHCRDLKAMYQKLVRDKEKRIGIGKPKEKYETRFRIRGWGDPRLRENRQV